MTLPIHANHAIIVHLSNGLSFHLQTKGSSVIGNTYGKRWVELSNNT